MWYVLIMRWIYGIEIIYFYVNSKTLNSCVILDTRFVRLRFLYEGKFKFIFLIRKPWILWYDSKKRACNHIFLFNKRDFS